ncbi:uncharacterized protein CELE_Y69A2AR.23 [Caenorhabditis elegans]|uniref:Uncharacterized protein n=1 Tax=Caenorhabditis elegans TaxID=6239 RepID=Q95XI4_CAEEL|nr:Uncharacterized protein CELE_Y69A2AR.23 [Caenorhabditis elegans]CCD74136.1 Uncharacterized protein CELE_Y69A2AR.23 [Caenorhabditis elegans]|eukprot:NP_500219.2 Uncharacterized protein CELE_Y69A2AR.23 [Caenorhabditis elegans]
MNKTRKPKDAIGRLQNDFYKFFRTIVTEIREAAENIEKNAETVRNQPIRVEPVEEPKGFFAVHATLLITIGIILCLGILIAGPVYCCFKKRGFMSSEHVNEEIEIPDEDEEEQRSPQHPAASPFPKAKSPVSPRIGMSPRVGLSPKPIARTPQTARTPTKKGPMSPSAIGLSPMKKRSPL